MMKSRKLGIGLLLMLAVVVTTGTFAYWTAGLAADDAINPNVTVTIGAGDSTASIITLTAFTANSGSALIPTGQGVDGTDDTATWTIPIEWDEDTTSDYTGAVGDLTIAVTYAISGAGITPARLDELFTEAVGLATVTEGAVAADAVVTIVFAVEPLNQAEYDAITTGTLTVTITFTVTPQ